MHHENRQNLQDADAKMAMICQKWSDYSGQTDTSLLQKAYEFAKEAHQGQKRATGEPYIIHPVAAAEILLDLEVDKDTLIAALLHDTVEDTSVSLSDIADVFGNDIKTWLMVLPNYLSFPIRLKKKYKPKVTARCSLLWPEILGWC